VDITKTDEVDKAFSAYVASAGKIDVLISNADFGAIDPVIKDADCENWMNSIDINLKGSFLAAQAFLRSAAPDAVLVYISSVVSFGPIMSRYSSYAVSKAAAVRFFECVQIEYPEIRVVSIHPGIVDTDMTRKSGVPTIDDGEFSSPEMGLEGDDTD
jgi:NAD(P)-dependent dehydrogenase (short-subunit alcohol dehydrogenase family)